MGLPVVTAPAWSWPRRLAFRLIFAYSMLFALPGLIQQLPYGSWVIAKYSEKSDEVVRWAAKSVLHIEYDLGQVNGSGDRTFNYVEALCHLAIAGMVAVVWSIVDFRRPSYRRLHEVLRVTLRYSLAFTMIGYGLAKVFPPRQFQLPGADRLMSTYGDSSPMGILWTFMGVSQPYTIFAGLAEFLGGVLLMFRRTTLLGALVSFAVMLNIVLMNFCYDVPVKLFSSHLLAIAFYLTLFDMRRLINVFILNRPAPAAQIGLPFARRWQRVSVRIAKFVFLCWATWTIVEGRMAMHKMFGVDAPGHWTGSYATESFQRDGQDIAPGANDSVRWKSVSIYQGRFFSVRLMNGERLFFAMEPNDEAGTLKLTPNRPAGPSMTWTYTQPGPDQLQLEGPLNGATVSLRLKKVDVNQFLLMNRGFHWINEYPYNR